MTDLLTTMRQFAADAETDVKRLRAAIAVLEQAESLPTPRRKPPGAAPAQPRRAERDPRSAHRTSPAPTPTDQTSGKTTHEPAVTDRTAREQTKNAVVPLEKLLKLISGHPGMTTTALAKQTGGE